MPAKASLWLFTFAPKYVASAGPKEDGALTMFSRSEESKEIPIQCVVGGSGL